MSKNPETIEIHGSSTIHKLCKFAADRDMEGSTFTEIVERMFAELNVAKAQAVPETHLLIPKKPSLDITVWLLCQKDIGDNLSQAEYFYEELIQKFIETSESGAEQP